MVAFADIQVGDRLDEQRRETGIVQQFLYNAVLWNAHRIHYEARWAKEVEGYPDLVVAGPLLGDWLTQCVLLWLGPSGRLVSIEYSNRQAAYVGETLTVGGLVAAIDPASRQVTLDVAVRNADGEVVTPGTAVVEFGATS
jgi:3-methylfumaryl-CoA hydratase